MWFYNFCAFFVGGEFFCRFMFFFNREILCKHKKTVPGNINTDITKYKLYENILLFLNFVCDYKLMDTMSVQVIRCGHVYHNTNECLPDL